MDLINRNLGRRQFISVSSMMIGAGMLANPSRLLFAAEGATAAVFDKTRYGKYILSGYKEEDQDPSRGTFVALLDKSVIEGAPLGRFVRMPPPGPMPEHGGTETHDIPSFLIHLGNDPDDPMDLGAEVLLYLGAGDDRDKYTIKRSTAVYLPAGFNHCPWHVMKITKPITFIDIMVGEGEKAVSAKPPMPEGGGQGMPQGAGGQGGAMEMSGGPTEAELSKARTSGYKYDKYLLSGVSKDRKDPSGGRMIAYLDNTIFPDAPLTRIIRFQPKEAPFNKTEFSRHRYGTLLVHLGTDYTDPFDLGAEVELCIGEEKEQHTFNKSTVVYIPAGIPFGPWQIRDIKKPFNFMEVVLGPETPF